MPDNVPREFAETRKGLVVAPAGCGKTHLIADSVAHNQGRQLVLTHTHAGVRAILDHLRRRGVAPQQYRVSTIDGFALRYANAFPSLSGWRHPQPTGDTWNELRPAAAETLTRSAIRRVVGCSYTGVYVDEYQDCTVGQHDLILALSEILPVRILGDPLQSAFWKVNRDDNVRWQVVESDFHRVAVLDTPYRWIGKNEELGQWLLDVRQRLLTGKPIDLQNQPVSWRDGVEEQDQLRACLDLARNRGHSILGLRGWGNQCHRLARCLNGAYRSMETVECEALQEWSNKIESATGADRVCHILEFAKLCIARLPSVINDWMSRFGAGQCPNPQRKDYRRVVVVLGRILRSDDLILVDDALSAIERIDARLVHGRHELWREMRRTIQDGRRFPGRTLSECAWHLRNRARHVGRRVDRRCLATTLLAKGLEFDHAVVLKVEEMDDAENLYVAMTRGSRSLTVLSTLSQLRLPLPHFTRQDQESR